MGGGGCRWGGLWGVDVDVRAVTDCKLVSVSAADIRVRPHPSLLHRASSRAWL